MTVRYFAPYALTFTNRTPRKVQRPLWVLFECAIAPAHNDNTLGVA